MREIYIEILKVLIPRVENGDEDFRLGIAQLLVRLNDESIPHIDQDIVDFLSEFYAFILFGYIPDRTNRIGVIKNWEDLRQRLRALERPFAS